MKGFNEIRGQMFRMSYDPISGEFVDILIPRDIGKILSTSVLESKSPENFKPKTISRPEFEIPSVTLQALHKKRA